MSKYRLYTQHKSGINELSSWIDKKCKLCGRFISLHGAKDLCHKCSKEIDNTIDVAIRRYSLLSVREYIGNLPLPI